MKESLKLTIGERVGDKRSVKRLMQKDLAEIAGIPAGTIHNIECAHSYPSVSTLVKLADALESSTDYLLGRTDFDVLVNPLDTVIGEYNGKPLSVGDMCTILTTLKNDQLQKVIEYAAVFRELNQHRKDK